MFASFDLDLSSSSRNKCASFKKEKRAKPKFLTISFVEKLGKRLLPLIQTSVKGERWITKLLKEVQTENDEIKFITYFRVFVCSSICLVLVNWLLKLQLHFSVYYLCQLSHKTACLHNNANLSAWVYTSPWQHPNEWFITVNVQLFIYIKVIERGASSFHTKCPMTGCLQRVTDMKCTTRTQRRFEKLWHCRDRGLRWEQRQITG